MFRPFSILRQVRHGLRPVLLIILFTVSPNPRDDDPAVGDDEARGALRHFSDIGFGPSVAFGVYEISTGPETFVISIIAHDGKRRRRGAYLNALVKRWELRTRNAPRPRNAIETFLPDAALQA